MSKTLKVKLGGKSYDVPKLNVGQLREVTRLFRGDQEEIAFDVVKVAFDRVRDGDAPVDFESIEAGLDEIVAASTEILQHAGFKRDDKSPPPAPE